MSNQYFPRGVFTDYFLTQVALTGKPVGDCERPRAGVAGWVGEPNADGTNFIPYTVVVPMDVAASNQNDFSDDQRILMIPYALTSYGVSRGQCEWLADLARKKVDDMRHTALDLDGGARSILNVLHKVGAVNRIGDQDPAYYGQTDVLTLLTSR